MCGQGPNGTILCCSWFHSHTEMNQVSGSPSAIAFVVCTVLLINLYMLQSCCLTLTERLFSASADVGRGVVVLNRPFFFHGNLGLLFVLAAFLFLQKEPLVCQGPKGRAALDSHDLFTKMRTHLTSPNNPERVQRYVKKSPGCLLCRGCL